MAEATKTSWNYVYVKDNAGNEFICPLGALKDKEAASDDELKNCIDDAKAGVPLGD
jgi:hypothetical protein